MNNNHQLSLVVPLFNEQDSVPTLLQGVHQALASLGYGWEIILVDDGSMDLTVQRVREAQAEYGDHVRLIELARNFGQTAAMQAGLDAARGDLIALMDGDLQNDARDIPGMLNTLLSEDLDAVVGWRKDRKDGYWLRTFPSRLANRLIGKVTGIHLHDYGCTLKVFRAHAISGLQLFGEMHRFIPAWIAMRTRPSQIREVPVRHHARQFGESKYGLSRIFRVLIDLMVVFFFMRYRTRPGHFFGLIGMGMGTAGSVMLLWLLGVKLAGFDIGSRPMFLTAIMLVVLSVQLLTTAVLSELLSRVYFESRQSPAYQLGHRQEQRPPAWKSNQAPTAA